MFLRIENCSNRKLIGLSIQDSLQQNEIVNVWKKFVPLSYNIPGNIKGQFCSMSIYPSTNIFNDFSINTFFKRCALVEVNDINYSLNTTESFYIDGMFALFLHKGLPSDVEKTFRYIFNQWLPNSKYEWALPFHFEKLPQNYSPNNPDAEEEIWLPIRLRGNSEPHI